MSLLALAASAITDAHTMSDRSRFLARLFGLYFVLVAVTMALQRDQWTAAVTLLLHAAALLWLLGTLLVAAGLALILTHNLWSGGLATVVVTVMGWLTLLKGLMLWVLGPAAADLYLGRLHYRELYYPYCALTLLLGLYLTGAGFRAAHREP